MAQYPFFAAEIWIGMQDRVLHEGEAIFGKCSLDRITVNDVLRGAGELAVEVEAGNLVIGGGEHALVDVLESLEAVEIGAGLSDDDVIPRSAASGHATGWRRGAAAHKNRTEFGRGEPEFASGVALPAHSVMQRRGEKIDRVLGGVGVRIGGCDQVGLERPVGCAVVGIGRRNGGQRRAVWPSMFSCAGASSRLRNLFE